MPLPITALRSNVEFVRDYFRSYPSATVREAVRAASQARHGLHWEEVARIHRQMLPELHPMSAALAQELPKLAAVPHPPPAQKPRSPVEILKEAVPLAPAPKPETPKPAETTQSTEAAPQPTGEKKPMHKKSAKAPVPLLEVSKEDLALGRQKRAPGASDVRRRYLNTYLEKFPEAGVAQCVRALEDTFGWALMMSYVQETVALHRAARAAQPAKLPPAAAASAPPALPAPSPLPSPTPAPVAVQEAAPARPAAPVPATGPEAYPVLQWGPPPAPVPRPSLEEEVRALANRLRAVCESHGVQAASLSWTPERRVLVTLTRNSTLEV